LLRTNVICTTNIYGKICTLHFICTLVWVITLNDQKFTSN